jgi:RHS repeat-associated protein
MVAVNYLWNPINDNIVREFDDSGNTTSEYTTEPDLYGNVVSQFRNGQTSYLLSDGQGNTTELTNNAGTVTDTIRYSGFGEVTGRTGTTEIPFQYVGQKEYYRDTGTGDYYVRERSLGPAIGRWLCVDPISVIDGPDLYLYVRNNPTLVVDPSGLSPMVPHAGQPHGTRSVFRSAALTGFDPEEEARKAVEDAVRFVDQYHSWARTIAEPLFRLKCKEPYGTCFLFRTRITSITVTINFLLRPINFIANVSCAALSATLPPVIRHYALAALRERFPRKYLYMNCVCGTACGYFEGATVTAPTIPAATFPIGGPPCHFTATLGVGVSFSAFATCCLTTSGTDPLPRPLPPAVPREEFSSGG